MASVLGEKSLLFAIRVVNLFKHLSVQQHLCCVEKYVV